MPTPEETDALEILVGEYVEPTAAAGGSGCRLDEQRALEVLGAVGAVSACVGPSSSAMNLAHMWTTSPSLSPSA